MVEKKNKFNALTPEILGENKQKQIYIDALDFALSNTDIKNIAITGIYGSGKSTIWNTYVYVKKLDNVITVSLGKYTNYIETDDKAKEESITRNVNESDISDDNRIERQLINQILSQIESNKIPLSKYNFKSNKSDCTICLQSLASLSIILSILLWITRGTIVPIFNKCHKNFNEVSLIILCFVLLFVPLCYYLYIFHIGNKFSISKITFKGAEANLNDADISDETLLDRDIKELVYLIRSSDSKIVVFEDLDRYDNTSIYIKLRELNFLLNKYIKVNDKKGTEVRFIYMLRDDLFLSKNRTKFFDFILPIVPVVDSKTSENELIELLKGVDNAPNRGLLADISLYVDDMRLLKNIVNEYIVYSKIIPLNNIDLDCNKLFAIITLKNIFPNEFDLLQEDKGFIRSVFDKLEAYKEKIVSNLTQELKEIDDDINFINSRIDNDKFKAMALMVRSDVGHYKETRTWAEYLKEWSKNPDNNAYIKYSGNSSSFSYDEFINNFILNNDDNKALLEKLAEDLSFKMKELNLEKEKIKQQINDIEIYSYKEKIAKLTAEQKDELFSSSEFNIVESHYFPLIRFLIVDGLLDETYWYYKGNFNVDTSNILKRNDIIYMKGLKEGKDLDIFLDVETPKEIIRRLDLSDFSRFNILNKKIFKICLEENCLENVKAIIDSVDINHKYEDLLSILDEFDLDLIKIYSNMLLRNKMDKLVKSLEFFQDKNIKTLHNVLISILTIENIGIHNLRLFKKYIEQNERIISLVPEKEFDIFINNIDSIGIKFDDISKSNCEKEELKCVEEISAYKLNVENLMFIIEKILEKNIDYGSLLNVIYESSQLSSSKSYIKDNFYNFISEYIEKSKDETKYMDTEEILLDILNSDISNENKCKYIEKNETILSKLTDLDSEILNCLLIKNKIKFCSDNIKAYWDIVQEEYSNEFYKYLENNLNEINCEEILENNDSVCNSLINDPSISDKVFAFIIGYANKPIRNIDVKLTQNKVNMLVKHRLIEINKKNIKNLLHNLYYTEIILLVNDDNKDNENQVTNILLECDLGDELIYSLVNSEISDENSLKLINLIQDRVLIAKIKPAKKNIIEYIIREDLSSKNINYILQIFNTFELKDEFIESLDDKGILEDFENEKLNNTFMEYVLSKKNVGTDTKVSLILTKINNNSDIDILKQYLLSVDEISDLSDVWNDKRPKLDNYYKERVGEALVKSNYAKYYNDTKCQRIKKIKKGANNKSTVKKQK